jgi:hypothetical protein
MVATAASIAFTTVGPPFDSACLPLGWDSAFLLGVTLQDMALLTK